MRSLRGLRGRETTVLVLLVCFLALSIPALAQTLEKDLERKQDRRQVAARKAQRFDARADQLEQTVAALDIEAGRIQTEVNRLNTSMDELNGRIAVVQRDLTAAQQRLNFLSEELQAILTRLEKRTDLFTNRAVAAYMAGPTSHLEGLLSSTTFNEVVDRTSYYESALDADSELVEGIEVLRDETEVKRAEVEEEQAQIATKKLELEGDKTELAQILQERRSVLDAQRAVLAQKESLLAQAETQERKYLQVVEQLDADAARIESLLAAREAAAAASSAPAPVVSGGQLLWPTAGPLTSPYGYRTHPIFGDQRLHTGIDIGAPYGATVVAAEGGVVAYVGAMSGYGNVIVIDHGGGLATTYNHLSAFSVSSGQSVGRGTPIANVGCTGYCTGPHLHFEVRVGGSPVDPMPYLQ
ncbi:MAG: peptidoglycan DD-metalloendopeptidase family protein [Actinomycetota bacterium]|nr:peptidoglycan DD-metalloendopeptidase family protein [Actinomycetota bacterium]